MITSTIKVQSRCKADSFFPLFVWIQINIWRGPELISGAMDCVSLHYPPKPINLYVKHLNSHRDDMWMEAWPIKEWWKAVIHISLLSCAELSMPLLSSTDFCHFLNGNVFTNIYFNVGITDWQQFQSWNMAQSELISVQQCRPFNIKKNVNGPLSQSYKWTSQEWHRYSCCSLELSSLTSLATLMVFSWGACVQIKPWNFLKQFWIADGIT